MFELSQPLEYEDKAVLKARRRREVSRKYCRKVTGSTEESRANSCTYFARKWEERIAKWINAEDCNAEHMGKPYDLLWNGLKINLKVSNLYRRKMKRGKPVKSPQAGIWTFKPSKGYCDYYLCICLNENRVEKSYLIPPEQYSKGTSVGRNSIKYKDYLFPLEKYVG